MQLAYPSNFYLFFVRRWIDALTPTHNLKAFSLLYSYIANMRFYHPISLLDMTIAT
jgi:hypothetical protein